MPEQGSAQDHQNDEVQGGLNILDKKLIEVESWLSEYIILEKRIDALYKQSQRPHLREMFLKMGPKGDKNMAVDTDKVNVMGGHKPIPWMFNLEAVFAKVNEISDEIGESMKACAAQMQDIRCTVGMAGLDNEEALYVEQRYFLGMSVKEMERDGCRLTRLKEIKMSSLKKICAARSTTTVCDPKRPLTTNCVG